MNVVPSYKQVPKNIPAVYIIVPLFAIIEISPSLLDNQYLKISPPLFYNQNQYLSPFLSTMPKD